MQTLPPQSHPPVERKGKGRKTTGEKEVVRSMKKERRGGKRRFHFHISSRSYSRGYKSGKCVLGKWASYGNKAFYFPHFFFLSGEEGEPMRVSVTIFAFPWTIKGRKTRTSWTKKNHTTKRACQYYPATKKEEKIRTSGVEHMWFLFIEKEWGNTIYRTTKLGHIT